MHVIYVPHRVLEGGSEPIHYMFLDSENFRDLPLRVHIESDHFDNKMLYSINYTYSGIFTIQMCLSEVQFQGQI